MENKTQIERDNERLNNIIIKYKYSSDNRMTEISFAKTCSLDTTFELTNPTSDVAYRGSFSRANSGDLQGPLAAQEGFRERSTE